MSNVAFVVPSDYNQLVRDFGPFVSKVVQRYNNVPRHTADLLQDVWMHLIASDVLSKFKANFAKSAPQTMTALEAADFCDVSHRNFFGHIQVLTRGRDKGKSRWVPLPVSGGYASKSAVFMIADIVRLRSEARFVTRLNPDQPLPQVAPGVTVTRGRFEAYLTRCIHNHFANFCRTRERRDQDVYLAPMADGTAWEAGLHDCDSATPEERADLNLALSKLGDSGKDILELMDSGYTLSEACQRMNISVGSLRLVARG